MEVVNKNVRSKNKILEYLKSISVDANNTHIDIELDSMLISIVKLSSVITTLSEHTTNYSICLVCVDKENNIIYDDIFKKEFKNEEEADAYVNELINKVNNTNEKELKNLIISYNDWFYISFFNGTKKHKKA